MAILNTYPDLPLGIQGDEVIVCMPDSDGKTYNFYTTDLKTWLEAGLGDPTAAHDILEWDGAKWVAGRRTRAVGTYVDGATYSKGDELSDGANLSEALADGVESSPFVHPFGDPAPIYEGTGMATTPTPASQVVFGNRYSNTEKDFYFNGYRIFCDTGERYSVSLVADPDGTPEEGPVRSFVAAVDGWVEFSVPPVVIPKDIVFDIVVRATTLQTAPTDTVLFLSYQTPQNAGVPPQGTINHPRGEPSFMDIAKTDIGGTDHSVLIEGLKVGDSISLDTGGSWTVQSNTDEGSYCRVGVSPGVTGSAGLQDVTFSITATAPIEVPSDPGYWPTSPHPQGEGFLAVEGNYLDAIYDTNAYGVDILAQDAYIPPAEDWLLKIIAGQASSGGGGGDFTPTTFAGAGTTGYVADPVAENGFFLRDDGVFAAVGGNGGDYNIDGGFADSIYTPSQLIDGGGASG